MASAASSLACCECVARKGASGLRWATLSRKLWVRRNSWSVDILSAEGVMLPGDTACWSVEAFGSDASQKSVAVDVNDRGALDAYATPAPMATIIGKVKSMGCLK